jgi:hypothetical protein
MPEAAGAVLLVGDVLAPGHGPPALADLVVGGALLGSTLLRVSVMMGWLLVRSGGGQAAAWSWHRIRAAAERRRQVIRIDTSTMVGR